MPSLFDTSRTLRVLGKLPAIAVVLAVLIAVGVTSISSSGASGTHNAVDYSQCTDGTSNDADTDCKSWINGVLNANNSTYHEDEVVPQRLLVSNSAAGTHTITLRYNVRKGTTHAYDSLATWNYTQTSAVACAGLPANKCPDTSGSASKIDIPNDTHEVTPTGSSSISPVTTGHMIPLGAGRQFWMYGGTLTAFDMSADNYIHTTSGGDESASITITYTTSDSGNALLLFGGHLAAPSGSRGWGEGLGAADINGGPYHIKWDGVDGAAVGNRDNQIMGSAILHFPATIGSVPNVELSDHATLGTDADGGSVVFRLYKVAINGTPCGGSGVGGASGDLIYTSSSITVASGVADSARVKVSDTVTYPLAGSGIYNWIISYTGNGNVLDNTSSCGAEQVTVTL
jgi:hypothetical protein